MNVVSFRVGKNGFAASRQDQLAPQNLQNLFAHGNGLQQTATATKPTVAPRGVHTTSPPHRADGWGSALRWPVSK